MDLVADELMPTLAEAEQLVATLRAASADFVTLEARYGAPGPAVRNFGISAWRLGDLASAATLLRAALAFSGGDAAIWRDLAFVCNGLGETEAAYRAILAAVDRDPGHAGAWLMLGNLYAGAGRAGEAETAFQRALAVDPGLGDAHVALGFTRFNAKHFNDAVDHLEKAVALGAGTAEVHTVLGHLYFMRGDCDRSDPAFEAASRFGPLDAMSLEKWARARAFRGMVTGDVAMVAKTYAETAGDDALSEEDLLRAAFLHLNAMGERTAALSAGAARLRACPGDVEVAYLMDIQQGHVETRAPDAYVEAHFDRLADQFDQRLVGLLAYDGPAVLRRLIGPNPPDIKHILDLGCGTGLAAAVLSPFGAEITGVDLSGRMLEKAAARGVYSQLIKAEALAFLETCGRRYDLIFAADVLIYFGAMDALFEQVRAGLMPGGLFAFSVETATEGTYTVLPSGRFAHNPAYIEHLARGFTVVAWEPGVVRLEAQRPVAGLFVVLRRPQDDDA